MLLSCYSTNPCFFVSTKWKNKYTGRCHILSQTATESFRYIYSTNPVCYATNPVCYSINPETVRNGSVCLHFAVWSERGINVMLTGKPLRAPTALCHSI